MPESQTARRRGFLRFSLRAMLLLVVVIAAGLAWTMHKVHEQGIAVAALEKAGCRIINSDNAAPTALERLRLWFGEEHPWVR